MIVRVSRGMTIRRHVERHAPTCPKGQHANDNAPTMHNRVARHINKYQGRTWQLPDREILNSLLNRFKRYSTF